MSCVARFHGSSSSIDQGERFGQSRLGRLEIAEAGQDLGEQQQCPAQVGREGLAQVGDGLLQGIEC